MDHRSECTIENNKTPRRKQNTEPWFWPWVRQNFLDMTKNKSSKGTNWSIGFIELVMFNDKWHGHYVM